MVYICATYICSGGVDSRFCGFPLALKLCILHDEGCSADVGPEIFTSPQNLPDDGVVLANITSGGLFVRRVARCIALTPGFMTLFLASPKENTSLLLYHKDVGCLPLYAKERRVWGGVSPYIRVHTQHKPQSIPICRGSIIWNLAQRLSHVQFF